MTSAWGESWGGAWGNAFGTIAIEAPPTYTPMAFWGPPPAPPKLRQKPVLVSGGHAGVHWSRCAVVSFVEIAARHTGVARLSAAVSQIALPIASGSSAHRATCAPTASRPSVHDSNQRALALFLTVLRSNKS